VPKDRWPRAAEEQSASRELLGIAYGPIGQHVARLWGWPEALRSAMARQPWPTSRSTDPGLRLRWLAQCANDLADLMLDIDPQRWAAGCAELAQASHPCLGLDAKALQDAVSTARQDLQALAREVGLPVDQLPVWQASDPVTAVTAPTAAAVEAAAPDAAEPVVQPEAAEAPDPALPRCLPDAQHLTQAALRLTSDLLDRKTRGTLPAQALSALHVGLGARRAMLWRRQAPGGALRMVKTLGPSLPDSVSQTWTVDPTKGKDLFSRLCAAGNLSLIHDARRTDIAPHLPAAFRQHGVARCFMVLPVAVQGRTLGMIYLDRPDHDPFVLDGEALQLVRTLRDQTALAWDGAG
jgi:GAF domain